MAFAQVCSVLIAACAGRGLGKLAGISLDFVGLRPFREGVMSCGRYLGEVSRRSPQ